MRTKTLTIAALLTAALAGCGASGGSGGAAEDYPTKNIEMLVGFAPGGHNDTTARKFAASLEDELGQKILVVNRPGGGGVLASTEAANAQPDGYSLLFAPTGAFTSGMLQQSVSYDFGDFRSIQPVADNGFVVAVPADSPYKSLDDLSEASGRLTYSSFGEGHPTHLIGAEVAAVKGFEAENVGYDGSPTALQAIVNGDVDYGIQDVTSAQPRLKSGEIRALAISTAERVEALPDVPTVVEEGVENAVFTGSQALVVQAEAPENVIATLEEAAGNAVADPEFVEFVETNAGTVPDVEGEKWFTETVPAERDRFVEMYERLGIGD